MKENVFKSYYMSWGFFLIIIETKCETEINVEQRWPKTVGVLEQQENILTEFKPGTRLTLSPDFFFCCFIELNRWLRSEHSLDRMNLMSLIVYHKTYCSVCASVSARWPVSYGHAVVNQSAARGLLVCPAGNKSWRKIKKNLSQSHNPKSLTLLLLLISILWRACDSFAGWDSSKTIKWLLNKIIVFDAGGKKYHSDISRNCCCWFNVMILRSAT